MELLELETQLVEALLSMSSSTPAREGDATCYSEYVDEDLQGGFRLQLQARLFLCKCLLVARFAGHP
jgi:hypothetical protein